MKYTIYKNWHYANRLLLLPKTHKGVTAVDYLATFNRNCLYLPDSTNNHWNKLGGFGYGYLDDANSVRVAWRASESNPDKLELAPYVHQAGEKIHPETGIEIDIEKGYRIMLFFAEPAAEAGIMVTDSTGKQIDILTLQEINLTPEPGWYNRPYFGGKPTAPHTLSINLDIIHAV